MEGEQEVIVENRKAGFNYQLSDKYTAGIMLTGTEIKSVRSGKVNLSDSYCYFRRGDLYVKSMHISEYKLGNINNHEPRRDRKLLLKKRELKRLQAKLKERGYTLVPTMLFLNERGIAKLEIALAQGKKRYDKSRSIKEKDIKREMDKELKKYRTN